LQVLVTGSSGFIGNYTVNALLQAGHQVRTLDVHSKEDIRLKEQVEAKVKGVDAVIHLAALIDTPYSFQNPAEVADVNIVGTINVLEACRRFNVDKFIFASSAAVYGIPRTLPVLESQPLDPTTPYGLTKLVGENYARLYRRTYGLRTIILRYFNAYGAGQRKGLIPTALTLMRKNRPVILFGDGSQTRDFVNVIDIARINLTALHDDIPSGEYNIASGVETKVIQVLKILQNLTRTNLIDYRPERAGEIGRIYADISKAKEVMKFRPTVSITEGLSEVAKSN